MHHLQGDNEMRDSRSQRYHASPTFFIPHQGSLCRLEDNMNCYYIIEVTYDEGSHDLLYTRRDFDFAQRLFAILDTESRGVVDRETVRSFVTLRCPVFWRRDEDLRNLTLVPSSETGGTIESPTFDEMWQSVTRCSRLTSETDDTFIKDEKVELGIEGWMVFCRFIALAQYLEARRRFSARHLQQTMRHRNSPRGSEVVVIEVPPLEPPSPLSPEQLVNYELKSQAPLPIPELDLDHSLMAAHDTAKRCTSSLNHGRVNVELFGSHYSNLVMPSTATGSSQNLDFAISFTQGESCNETNTNSVVRRSMDDLKWLDDTFISHKELGGTLCGRILPPFPGSFQSRSRSSSVKGDETVLIYSSGIISSKVGRLKDAAKSLLGNYLVISSPSDSAVATRRINKKRTGRRAVAESYYNVNTPECKARHLERYLNYLLEHPALSASFPLNAVLQVRFVIVS
jgi:hypothetical protein